MLPSGSRTYVVGSEKRVKGSHLIFPKEWCCREGKFPKSGRTGKPYQVKQVRAVILEAKLGGE